MYEEFLEINEKKRIISKIDKIGEQVIIKEEM